MRVQNTQQAVLPAVCPMRACNPIISQSSKSQFAWLRPYTGLQISSRVYTNLEVHLRDPLFSPLNAPLPLTTTLRRSGFCSVESVPKPARCSWPAPVSALLLVTMVTAASYTRSWEALCRSTRLPLQHAHHETRETRRLRINGLLPMGLIYLLVQVYEY